ncbi:hypothetical protein PsorP6_003102 [Peronosclerospora sorghi]|uniref:Uncharacterized protein n=1 Tax=Peronosclerospora sorghi TaxID=230839 RepID=A0ACC0VLQ5_9STRA|nr:hypothetical protein PsorP6_003102 [Peronosclerospora sorghi]
MTTRLSHATQSEHVPYEIYADAPLATDLLTIRAHQFTVAVKKLGRPVDRTEWAMTSAEVNAYYQPRANQMVFPAGILQPPFFSKDYDPARNFGSIGSIVGHELTHGFDATGRHYDASGTLHDWWSNETAHEFTKRTQCLVEQYGRYNVSSTTDPTHVLGHVNGQYTLSENIADNGGVKLAFHAYQAARATHNATGDKLFFLSFAQTFCAKRSDQAMTEKLASDPHAPERWRINGVASNSHDFARVFQCPVTARMNPPTKCQVW